LIKLFFIIFIPGNNADINYANFVNKEIYSLKDVFKNLISMFEHSQNISNVISTINKDFSFNIVDYVKNYMLYNNKKFSNDLSYEIEKYDLEIKFNEIKSCLDISQSFYIPSSLEIKSIKVLFDNIHIETYNIENINPIQ